MEAVSNLKKKGNEQLLTEISFREKKQHYISHQADYTLILSLISMVISNNTIRKIWNNDYFLRVAQNPLNIENTKTNLTKQRINSESDKKDYYWKPSAI